MCIHVGRLVSKILNYSCFFLHSFIQASIYYKVEMPLFLFDGGHNHTHWVVSKILLELHLCNFTMVRLFFLSLVSGYEAALYSWQENIESISAYVTHRDDRVPYENQNVTTYTCLLLHSPNPGCGCRQTAKLQHRCS